MLSLTTCVHYQPIKLPITKSRWSAKTTWSIMTWTPPYTQLSLTSCNGDNPFYMATWTSWVSSLLTLATSCWGVNTYFIVSQCPTTSLWTSRSTTTMDFSSTIFGWTCVGNSPLPSWKDQGSKFSSWAMLHEIFLALNIVGLVCPHLVHSTPLLEKEGWV